MRKKLFFDVVPFKRSYLEGEAGTGEGGSGGGAGGTGTAPTPEELAAEKAKAQEAAAAQAKADKDELERLRTENQKLAKIKEGAAAHVEIDEATGEVKPKVVAAAGTPTAEELDRIQLSGEVADKAMRVMEANRVAEQKTIDKHKAADPLFSINYQKAREKMEKLHPSQRTEEVWDRAYSMAKGENVDKYAEHYRAEGKRTAQEEFVRANGGALPQGGGGGTGGSGTVDLTKIVLSREQVNAANKMIDAGMLKNMDEYKANLISMGLVEVGS